jgi:hypothetical protein
MHSFPFFVLAILGLIGQSAADCESSGYDFVNGGGPYCINTTSTDYFSFGTEFEGNVPMSMAPIIPRPEADLTRLSAK